MQPSQQPSWGWAANGFMCKVGRVGFWLTNYGEFVFCIKVDILVELLWGWICFNYFVRLILHGITSHALNHFGWGWGGVKNVQFWKFFFCNIHFEFVVFWGLFWGIHSDITRYIHVYAYTYTYTHIHIYTSVLKCCHLKKYMKYNNFCFLTKCLFSVFTIIVNYIISHMNKVENRGNATINLKF